MSAAMRIVAVDHETKTVTVAADETDAQPVYSTRDWARRLGYEVGDTWLLTPDGWVRMPSDSEPAP